MVQSMGFFLILCGERTQLMFTKQLNIKRKMWSDPYEEDCV